MRFNVYQVSRKGGRPKNEDRMGYCYTRSAGLFALADGMGGHPEGEVASQLALQTLSALFQRDAKPTLKDPLRFLQEAVMAGHQQLLCRPAVDEPLAGRVTRRGQRGRRPAALDVQRRPGRARRPGTIGPNAPVHHPAHSRPAHTDA